MGEGERDRGPMGTHDALDDSKINKLLPSVQMYFRGRQRDSIF